MKLLPILLLAVTASALPTPMSDTPIAILPRTPVVHHEIAASGPLVASIGPYKNPFATWQPGDPVDKRSLEAQPWGRFGIEIPTKTNGEIEKREAEPVVHHEIAASGPLVASIRPYENPWATWQPGDPVEK